jgi:transglutaminase-like putative cysteine protease
VHRRLAGGLLAIAIAAASARADEFTYLFVIPTSVTAAEQLDLSRPLRLAVYVNDAARFAGAQSGALHPKIEDGRVLVDLRDAPEPDDAPTQAQLAPSFMIDFDEPAVQERVAELRAKHGERPSIPELIEFAAAAIPTKTFSKGFDLPSEVARHGAGDCSEHALLLTALARAVGRPARALIGTAVVLQGQSISAFGHAWAEIHDGERWVRGDATGVQNQTTVRYLRSAVLDREGPGYAMGLVGQLGTRPTRIEVVGYAGAEPGAAR